MIAKYRNIKTNGYDSRKEAKRAAELKLLERAGEIRNLREQVPLELLPSLTRADGTKERPVVYKADFVYEDAFTGEEIIEDTKGYRTPDYILKRKMVLFFTGKTIKET